MKISMTWDDFIHKVKMTGNFEDSEIDSDDIAFFAPSMKNWKKRILLKGKISGPVECPDWQGHGDPGG